MKIIGLLIVASIITYVCAGIVKGPQTIDSHKQKQNLQKRQEEDDGVDVDPVITVSNIEVFDVTPKPAPVTSATSSEENNSVSENASASEELETDAPVNVDDAPPLNRYCKCSSFECKCCRDFSLPIVPIAGPGCASIRYLENDKMTIGIKFGNRVLATRTISARRDTPVCLPLPGGFSNFCGRIYGIGRENENFKACLGLELRADNELEAALRVSCFEFGPRGLKVTEAEPIPVPTATKDEDDDEDDDDDEDFFGLGGADDEDDDPLGFDDATVDDSDADDFDEDAPTGSSAGAADDDDDDVDYTGFSLLTGDLLDDFLEDDDDTPDRPDPIPARKNLKNKKTGTVKKPQDLINSASPDQNEIDSNLSNTETSVVDKRPETSVEEVNTESIEEGDEDDDDDDEEEEEDSGILSLVSTFLSDDDDDDDDDEEIEEENAIEDEATKDDAEDDEAADDEDDLDDTADEVSAEAVADEIDDDDDDDDEDDYLDETTESYKNKKPAPGFSFLGLRNFLSRLRQN